MPSDEQPVMPFEFMKLPWDIVEHVVGYLDRIAYRSLPLCSREVREKVNPILFRKIALPQTHGYGKPWEDGDGPPPQMPPMDVLQCVRFAAFEVAVVDMSEPQLQGVRKAIAHQTSLMPRLAALTHFKLVIQMRARRYDPLERPVEDLAKAMRALLPTSTACRVEICWYGLGDDEVVRQVVPPILREISTLPELELVLEFPLPQSPELFEAIRPSFGMCGASIKRLKIHRDWIACMPIDLNMPAIEQLRISDFDEWKPLSQAKVARFVAKCMDGAKGGMQGLHLGVGIAKTMHDAPSMPEFSAFHKHILREITCTSRALPILSGAFKGLACEKAQLLIYSRDDLVHLHDLLSQRSSLPGLRQLRLHMNNVAFDLSIVNALARIRSLAFGRSISLSINLKGAVQKWEKLEPMLEAIRCLAGELRSLDLSLRGLTVPNHRHGYPCMSGIRLSNCAQLAIQFDEYAPSMPPIATPFFAQYLQTLLAPNLRMMSFEISTRNCDFLERIEQLLRQHAWPRLCCIQGDYVLLEGKGEIDSGGEPVRERWKGFVEICDQRGIDITGLDVQHITVPDIKELEGE